MHPWFTETEPTTDFFMETPTDTDHLEKCYTVTRLSQTHNTAARGDAGSVASDVGIWYQPSSVSLLRDLTSVVPRISLSV